MPQRIVKKLNSWLVFIFLSAVIMLMIIASYFLIDYLRKEEIKRSQLFATAMTYLQDNSITDPAALDLILQVTHSNTSMPMIITNAKGEVLGRDMMKNIPEETVRDPAKLKRLLAKMKASYPPFVMKSPSATYYVYYTNSPLLNKLRYSPIYLGLLVFAYVLFSLWFISVEKKTSEGFVWAGLAKETAHQIGTPLSSMIGWIEILRLENPDSEGVTEIEKDISRLKTITERFSKIGSVPELNDMNLSETVQQNYDYLKSRISSRVNFILEKPQGNILLPHNRILMSWVIENLVKNAVDAMKGTGSLQMKIQERNKNIVIDFIDSGSGMSRRQARKVFQPGFSTKKRGWGLGLSLAKRVIEEYHQGDIKVARTDIGKGTTFRIILPNNI